MENKNLGHKIDGIVPGSIAEELGLEAGDYIVTINGEPVEDVLDYRFLCKEEYLDILIRRGDEEAIFEVEKDADEELGLIFDNGLMDEYHSCCNKCIFCFIDQMPPDMRETLYFKDDDERLSFLQGNYITLTNLKEHDIERIIRYRLSPINISIQSMNPVLRCEMLHNRFAGDSLAILDRFYEAGITMNAQIVLCEGVNDGDELEFTIDKLSHYLPYMESVSVVPVGLTKYRQGLAELKPISLENANRTIDMVEKWQKKLYPEYGLHFIHASDEFYLMTGRELPSEETYDGYLQYENGVGMLRLLQTEFANALEDEDATSAIDDLLDAIMSSTVDTYESELEDAETKNVLIVTGQLPAPTLRVLADDFTAKHKMTKIDILPIKNEFFGNLITVAGLVTGSDLIAQTKAYIEKFASPDYILIPQCMLRSGEEVFLDDVTLTQASEELGCDIYPVANDGFALYNALRGKVGSACSYQRYEL